MQEEAREDDANATERFFADRRARADFSEFDRIMRRCGGKPPRDGDEMPE